MNPLAKKLQSFKVENRPKEDHPDLNAYEQFWVDLVEDVHLMEELAAENAHLPVRLNAVRADNVELQDRIIELEKKLGL